MKYFVLFVSRLLRWYSSPADGGRYDMTRACPQCGAGAVRIDPLFVAPSACKAGVAATYKQQIIVSRDVFSRLAAVGVKSLRQAISKKKEPVDFWSLEPDVVLPPWSHDSDGFERSAIQPSCRHCHRDGFYDRSKQNLELFYELDPSADVCATWEHFGVSRLSVPFENSLFASPRLIVSQRVCEILGDFTGVEFAEVKIRAQQGATANDPTCHASCWRTSHAKQGRG